ncbi:MAG: hypothetical protein KF858_03385 [Candidatus Sumerlaeia bacterium]|nr:hypothetical protein [Candidatus Sumerlaeia bacterium]
MPESQSPARPLTAVAVALLLVWGGLVLLAWSQLAWKIGFHPSLYGPPQGWEFPAEQLRALGAFVALTLCGWGWGRWLGRGLDILPERAGVARLAVMTALGQVAMALVIFAVGVARLLPWGLLVVVVGLVGLRGEGSVWKGVALGRRRLPAGAAALLVLAALSIGLAFLLSFAPMDESDGVRYHVFGPQEYLKAGGIVGLPHHAFTNLPFQVEMLFLAALAFANERATQPMHWSSLPLALAFLWLLAERVMRVLRARRESVGNAEAWGFWPVAGAVAGALAPVTLVVAAWPFVDVATLAFGVASIWALCPGSLRSFDKRLLLSGLLAGAAIGTKLTAVAGAGFTGLVVLGLLASRPRKFVRLLLFVVPLMVVPAPWFAKNVVLHGNPVYPAAWGFFGGPEWTDEADALYKRKAAMKGREKTLANLPLSPLDATLFWGDYEKHNPGPAMLALLPATLVGLGIGLARRRRSAVMALLALHLIGGWGFWFFTYQSVRFLMFHLAVTAVVGVCALGWLTRARPRLRLAAGGLVILLTIAGAAWHAYYSLATNYKRPLHGALGIVSGQQYLSTNLNFYDAVEWLNLNVQPGESVLYIGEHRGTYARYPVELSDWFDVPRLLVEIRATPDNDLMIRSWRERGVRYLLWNYEELGLYEWTDFEPRFQLDEWKRYEALRERLLPLRALVFRPRQHVLVIDLSLVR